MTLVTKTTLRLRDPDGNIVDYDVMVDDSSVSSITRESIVIDEFNELSDKYHALQIKYQQLADDEYVHGRECGYTRKGADHERRNHSTPLLPGAAASGP